jgi:hypothetical protein
VATFIDFEHFIIPDEITFGGAVAGFRRVIFPAVNCTNAIRTGAGCCGARSARWWARGSFMRLLRLGKLLFGRQK